VRFDVARAGCAAMKNYIFILVAVAACKSSDAKQLANALPCEGNAAGFAKQLETANGYNMDLQDPKSQPAIDAAKKKLLGTEVAFKNCHFEGQGGDTVSFNGIECVMAGGEEGTKKFRHAAMEFDMKKLLLDVHGKVTEKDKHVVLGDCAITPHE
jgi:hypothetical protein